MIGFPWGVLLVGMVLGAALILAVVYVADRRQSHD